MLAAEEIGFPVAVKIDSDEVVHKSDVGGVALGLEGPEQVRAAFEGMAARHGGRMRGVRVQRMVAGGRETVIGMVHDRTFGPLVMFGLGGIHVEILKDVAFRVAPVSTVDAAEMIRAIEAYPLLAGVRGEAPVAFDALAEAIQRVSQLVVDLAEIAEMDVNPFLAFPEPDRCVAVDARIRLAEP